VAIRGVTAAVLAAGMLFACGCGGPPGAGTVNMTAIKAAAAQRGIPEAKAPGEAATKGGRKLTPGKALPRGRR
jgi:hypothetical protein